MSQAGNLWRLFAQAVTIFAALAVVIGVFWRANPVPLSYRDAVAKALPSVVSISGKDDYGGEVSIGSGVIVSQDGYILTNYHLIADIGTIEIGLQSGESLVAALVGIAPDIDIAVLQVNAFGLPAIGMADDSALQPGDIVFAIGNPFGLNRSTTMGIVSALGRDRLGLHGFERFIQTDAAINPGSSGGALANAEGELVGINSALFYRRQGIRSQGIGFAIPAALALDSYSQLTAREAKKPNPQGAELSELSARLRAEILGDRGEPLSSLLVTRVWQDSPAARVGLRAGDIILGINDGQPQLQISGGQLSSTVSTVAILRGSERLTLTFPAAAE